MDGSDVEYVGSGRESVCEREREGERERGSVAFFFFSSGNGGCTTPSLGSLKERKMT